MDYAKTLNDLRAQKAQLLKDAEALMNEGKYDEVTAKQDEAEKISNQISVVERQAALSAEAAELEAESKPAAPAKNPADEVRPFRNFGEQLKAIHDAATTLKQDNRLARINDAVLGGNEGTGADGGFAVQTDFAGAIMESAVSESELLRRIDRYTVGANSNSAKWLSVNETDVSSSVFGGIQMYWASEGATVAATKPAFREMKLELDKMMGFGYVTEELLEDAPFMSGLFQRGFALAADRVLTKAVIDGDGAGKPLGILNGSALITVAKESGQTAGTLTGANVNKMWHRHHARFRRNSVWVMHPDLEEQLPGLSIKSNDGSAEKFLWNPEGGFRDLDYQRILTRPVIFEDYCSAIGSKGDILLIDPSQYILLTKGTARMGWSIHVQWLTDQQCFRMVFRCGGAPKQNAPITLANSSNTRSAFVTLAARA